MSMEIALQEAHAAAEAAHFSAIGVIGEPTEPVTLRPGAQKQRKLAANRDGKFPARRPHFRPGACSDAAESPGTGTMDSYR